jgi:hypothetical protein
MMKRLRLLRQLISDDMYVVDERLIADAIMARWGARMVIADASFRNDLNSRAVRSFRLEHEARSFRLVTGSRRRQLQHS